MLLTLCAVAFTGGALGKLAKIPGGTLLAATIAVATAGFFLDMPHTPPPVLILAVQVLTGCMLGQSINRRFWHDFLQIWQPILTVVFIFTLLAVPFTLFLVWEEGFEPLTAVLAATPARMQDMIVLAGTAGSDAVTVMLMQLTRQFSIILLTPFMLAKYLKEGRKKKAEAGGAGKTRLHMPHFHKADATSYLILLVPGVLGATVGSRTGHILGPMLGAFCAVALTRVAWLRAGEVPFPKPIGYVIQSLAGILLGTRISPETIDLLLARIIPLALACFYVLLGGILISWVLHKRYGWHKALSWMAAAPGRTADMLAMSQDMDFSGRDRLALVSVHAMRQVYFTIFVSVIVVFL